MNFFASAFKAIIITLPCSTIAKFPRLAGPDPNGWQLAFNATEQAATADDLIGMYEASSVAKRMKWYEGHGKNGNYTLKSFGTNAFNYSANDYLYSLYVDGFTSIGDDYEQEVHGTFDGNPAEQYAHALVNDLLDLDAGHRFPDGLEVESILVAGIWMRVYHYLYNILRICKSNDPAQGLMRESLDKAAALWIGNTQVYGSNTDGVMLYNLAERASVEFGQDMGESRVNREFLSILDKIRLQISSNQCNTSSDTNDADTAYERLYKLLSEAMKQMNTLLVQRLIHFMSTNVDEKFTKLYALILVPQIRACSSPEYKYFMNNVVIRTSFSRKSFEETMVHLQNMYSCLGVTCNDVGSYSGSRMPQCNDIDAEPVIPIAGYTPGNDVRRYAKVDRDINQIIILLSQGNIGAAKDLYRFGRNMMVGSSDPISLNTLARELEFNNDGFTGHEERIYKMFEEYHDNDPTYADKLMQDGFQSTIEKQQAAIPRLLQTIVVPHYAIRASFEAYDRCKNEEQEAPTYFDKGVAVLVGSLEGAQEGGSQIGLSWLSLTKEFCSKFDCTNTNDIRLDEKVMNILQDAKQEILNGKCHAFLDNMFKLESLLLVPIIQGLLFYTKMRENEPTKVLNYESAKVFAQAILPVVKKVSETEASTIESNILNDITDPINTEEVRLAIVNVLDDGSDKEDLGIKCEEIGNPSFLDGKSLCS